MLEEERQKLKAQEEEILKQKELELQEAERIAKFVNLHETQVSNGTSAPGETPTSTFSNPSVFYEGAD